MTTKTFTISDDAEYVHTLDGVVPKHQRAGSDLHAAMNPPATPTEPRTEWVDEKNRTQRVVFTEDSDEVSLNRRHAFWREKFLEVADETGRPKIDPTTGRALNLKQYESAKRNLQLFQQQAAYHLSSKAERERVAAIRAEQDTLVQEMARRLIAEGETEAAIHARLRALGVPENRLPKLATTTK